MPGIPDLEYTPTPYESPIDGERDHGPSSGRISSTSLSSTYITDRAMSGRSTRAGFATDDLKDGYSVWL